tara:strand:+ start:350 stop:1018 length:669 start_codon:yes stop_codon:yes gene_type:complete
MSATIPEQRIRLCLLQGVTAISGDVSLLDTILDDLSPNDLATMKNVWTDHPPTVVSGYARAEGPFPCWAVTLMAEESAQDYTGAGQEAAFLGGDPECKSGTKFKRRVSGTFGINIYAEHPDVCAFYYRICRRIMNVGMWRLLEGGLNEPVLSGADLIPDPRYAPENLFTRRLTVTVEYEEVWDDSDALALALMTTIEDYLTCDGTLDIFHEDSGGGVHPVSG